MMTIKMLRNDRGSEDGVTVKFYEKDETYEVGASLGSALVKSGSAERVSGDDVEADPVPEAVEPAQTKAEKRQAEKENDKGDRKPVDDTQELVQEKAVAAAPQNKAVTGAPSNKATS